jgi:hypothetical protein
VDATEAKDTTEPAGDTADTSGDADEPSNIMLSVSRFAGETEDTSVLTRVDGDPSDVEVVEEPTTRIYANSNKPIYCLKTYCASTESGSVTQTDKKCMKTVTVYSKQVCIY